MSFVFRYPWYSLYSFPWWNIFLNSLPLLFRNEIKKAIFINNRRWDVKLRNGINIKLAENNILDSFNTKTATASATGTGTEKAAVGVDRDNVQLIALNTTSKQIANSSQKLEQYLNTLISIGAMTEKNTKSTHKGLAELRGSLV